MRRALGLACCLAALATPCAARADGDPASDVLLSQDAFFSYDATTTNGSAQALLELTKRVRGAGWPVKVAIIAIPEDLGAVSRLYTSPQQYADLLAGELNVPRLLVVTPFGFGGENLGDNVDTALAGLAPVKGGEALARQAITAVGRLAAADGHRVPVPAVDESAVGRRPYRGSSLAHNAPSGPPPKPGAGKRGGGGTSPLLYAGPPLLLFVVVLVLSRRGRRSA